MYSNNTQSDCRCAKYSDDVHTTLANAIKAWDDGHTGIADFLLKDALHLISNGSEDVQNTLLAVRYASMYGHPETVRLLLDSIPHDDPIFFTFKIEAVRGALKYSRETADFLIEDVRLFVSNSPDVTEDPPPYIEATRETKYLNPTDQNNQVNKDPPPYSEAPCTNKDTSKEI